jgi:hypothetical protein
VNHATRTRRVTPRNIGLAIVAALVVVVGACQGTTGPSASPAISGSPDASGPVPKPTHWPTTTIEGTIALGAADGEIWKAGVDLRKAAENEDVEAMWGAADGLVKLLEGISPNVPRLQSYAPTKDLGDQLEVAYGKLHDAAAQIRDAITGGQPDLVVDGFTKLTAAMDVYADVRPALSDATQQAIFMKRTFSL